MSSANNTPVYDLSGSGINSFKQCPYKFKAYYRDNLHRQGFNAPCTIGSAVHDGRQALSEGKDILAALKGAARHFNGHPQSEAPAVEKAAALATLLLQGYHQFLPLLATEHNEISLRYPLGGTPFSLKGRCDGLVIKPGNSWLYELKTTSSTLASRLEELKQAHQLPMYIWLVEKLYGVKLQGAVVEIIKKPVTRRRKSKGVQEPLEDWIKHCWEDYKKEPKRYYLRTKIKRSDIDIDGAMQTVRHVAGLIQHCDKHGYPMIKGEYCKTPYGDCEYKPLCWYNDRARFEHKPYEFDGETITKESKDNGVQQQQPEQGPPQAYRRPVDQQAGGQVQA